MPSDPVSQTDFGSYPNPYAPTAETQSGMAPQLPPEPKHSGLGIASFILALGCGFLTVVLVVIAGVMELSTPGGIDEDSVEAGLVGLAILAALFGSFVAFILGVSGLFQARRKKILAVLGILFSGLTLVGTVGLIVFGLSIEQ